MKTRTTGLRSVWFRAIAGLVVAVALASCGGRFGNIVMDDQVMKSFETFRMDEGMDYYYSGPDLVPNAIIGLKKGYVLEPDTWKPLPRDPKLFKDMIVHMQEKGLELLDQPRGFVMTDPEGKPVGVWYSIMKARKTLRMGEGKKVVVYPPDLVIYQEGPLGGPTRDKD